MLDAVEELGAGRASPVARRRRWSEAGRLWIVAESYQPRITVSVVARRNDVNANLLFAWRRRYGKQAAEIGSGGHVPVVMEPSGARPPLADTVTSVAPATGHSCQPKIRQSNIT